MEFINFGLLISPEIRVLQVSLIQSLQASGTGALVIWVILTWKDWFMNTWLKRAYTDIVF